MKYRIALIGIVLGYFMLYIGQALLNGFLFFLIARFNKDAFWCGFGLSILPIGCWIEIGIIQLIVWLTTGDYLHSETLYKPIDWCIEKADEEKKKKKLWKKEYGKDYQKALKKLNKQYPGARL